VVTTYQLVSHGEHHSLYLLCRPNIFISLLYGGDIRWGFFLV